MSTATHRRPNKAPKHRAPSNWNTDLGLSILTAILISPPAFFLGKFLRQVFEGM